MAHTCLLQYGRLPVIVRVSNRVIGIVLHIIVNVILGICIVFSAIRVAGIIPSIFIVGVHIVQGTCHI